MTINSSNETSPIKAKVAIVTGSSTGVGYEITLHLARNGFYTYGSMRNLQKSNEINEIAKTESLPLHVIQLDVTDDISINKAVDTVINESGRIDVLVNNAGYCLIGSIEDTSVEELKAQFETNVFGAFRVTQAASIYERAAWWHNYQYQLYSRAHRFATLLSICKQQVCFGRIMRINGIQTTTIWDQGGYRKSL